MHGGCHCQLIRFEVTTNPFWVGACYCIDCRKVSGAPYVVWAGYKVDDVKYRRNTPKMYASSKNVYRGFCDNCGSSLSYQYKEQDKIFLPIGSFDDASNFKLQKHVWVSQKLPWIHIVDDLPQQQGSN